MLTLKYIQDNPQSVIDGLAKKRFDATAIVHSIISLTETKNLTQAKADKAKAEMNTVAREIGVMIRDGKTGEAEKAKEARLRGIKAAQAKLMLNPDDTRALYMGANGFVGLGEFDRGLEWAKQALDIDSDEPMVLYNVACIQSLAGKYEDALQTLEIAVAAGLTQKGWLEHDSNLDPLRQSPRYKKLIRQLSSLS